jgi:hypothetical protein
LGLKNIRDLGDRLFELLETIDLIDPREVS